MSGSFLTEPPREADEGGKGGRRGILPSANLCLPSTLFFPNPDSRFPVPLINQLTNQPVTAAKLRFTQLLSYQLLQRSCSVDQHQAIQVLRLRFLFQGLDKKSIVPCRLEYIDPA